jgi:uncharacterized protein (UPF0333 family)
MDKRAQGAAEYLLMLGAILVVTASIVIMIGVIAQTTGAGVSVQIDNTMENVVIPGLVGALLLGRA